MNSLSFYRSFEVFSSPIGRSIGMIFVFGLLAVVVATMIDVDPGSCENPRGCTALPINALPEEGLPKNRKYYNQSLDREGFIEMTWWLDYGSNLVTFEIDFSPLAPEFEWFALGFSDYGNIGKEVADFCLLSRNLNGATLTDIYQNINGEIIVDDHNDCLDFYWNKKSRILQYSRYFDTCDNQDYVIEDATTHIIWALGDGNVNPTDTDGKHGMVRVQLLKNEEIDTTIPPDARVLEVRVHNIKVPATDTTYFCSVKKMPDWLLEKKHHIIRFAPIITPGNEAVVHHIEVFYCNVPKNAFVEMYNGSCNKKPQSTMSCTKVRAAWAMGAIAFTYPKQTGLPLGGPDSNPHIMMEVHYNNPEMISTYVDSSGILIHLTPILRKYDASIMELGLEYIDKMVIPPRQEQFYLPAYCTSQCTETGLPKGGIIVFGSQLHTHLTGRAVETRHYRNGIELPILNKDYHYSTHFQEIRTLRRPVHVKPGDFLITTCTYKTTHLSNVTFGGFSIQDEMCVNYIHYYPASNLEVCKSSVSTAALNDYFSFEKYWEDMPTNLNKTIHENYNSIEPWNRLRAKALENLYYEQSISMQCNQSNGNRFPGFWDTVERDPIYSTLPLPKRNCSIYN